jgi:hypothetical protein
LALNHKNIASAFGTRRASRAEIFDLSGSLALAEPSRLNANATVC